MVPGKTPPDASGSRPDSRYGKPSDVAARLSGQHAPRERCVNRPVGSAPASSREMGRSPSPRHLATPQLHGTSASCRFGRLAPGSIAATRSAKSHRQAARTRVGGGLSTTGLGPTDPGGPAARKRRSRREMGVSSGAAPFRRAVRPASPKGRPPCGAIRRCGCGHDQDEPVITSSPDFPPREQRPKPFAAPAGSSSGTFSYRDDDCRAAASRQGQLTARAKNLVHNKSGSAQ